MTNKSLFIFLMLFFFLFSAEICYGNFNKPYTPNLLLIFLAYLLYQQQPLYQYIITIFGIELISLLQSGINGMSSIILIPLMSKFFITKTFLHFKLLTPLLFIVIYEVIYESIMFLRHVTSCNFMHVCLHITINCVTFLIFYWILPLLNTSKINT